MTPPFFTAYKEHSLDMGIIDVLPAIEGVDLTGSVATLRIGKIGQSSLFTLSSEEPPEEGVFLWDTTEKTLAIDLPSSTFEELPLALYWYRITITTSAGVPLPPPLLGQMRLADVVRS